MLLGGFAALALIAGGCSDDPEESLNTGSEVRSEQEFGADGWSPNVVIGSQGSDTGVYFLGGHREAPTGPSFESRIDSFRLELDGSVTEIADPPITKALGSGSGVAIGDQLFALVQVCEAGGDPTSAGYGCVLSDIELQFLRYDAEADEWTKLRLPTEIAKADPFTPPSLVAGRLTEGGPLYFALVSAEGVGVTTQVLRYDPQSDKWATVVEDPNGLTPACTDGASLYMFDREQLVGELAGAAPEGSTEGVVAVNAELRVFDPEGQESTEQVEADYPVSAGFAPEDVIEVLPWCMRDGAVLVTVALGDPQPDVSWPVRTSDGTWTATETPAPVVRQPFPWDVVSFDDSVALVAGEEETRGAGLPGFVFDVQTMAWSPLPSRPGAVVPQRQITAGPSHIATYPPEPARAGRGVTILEVDG